MAYMRNMTEGKTFPIIFRYFIPILCSSLLQQLYAIVDTIVVGKGINDMALAAVGSTGSINFFVFGFIMGLGSGMAVLVAQAYGGQNYERLRRSITMGIMSCGTVAVAIMVLGIALMRPLLLLLQTSDVIIDDAVLYISIIFSGIPLTLLYNCFSGILNSLGDSRTPLIAVSISTVINVVLDLLFVIVCQMGVEGVAYGTLIAQLCSGLFCYMKIRRIPFCRISRADWKPDTRLIREVFRVGIPVAFMNSVTAIGTVLVQYFVNRLGVSYTAAYSACSRIVGFMMQPCAAAGMTMSTFSGQNYGAGKFRRILQGLRSSGGLAILIAGISMLLLCGIPAHLTRLMLSDENNIALCVNYLRVCGVMMWSISFLFVVRNTLQGIGSTTVPMLSGFLELAARALVVSILTPRIGFIAVAIGEVSAWTSAFMLNGGFLWWKLRRLLANSSR